MVEIYYTWNNFSEYAPILDGCVSTAGTSDDIKKT